MLLGSRSAEGMTSARCEVAKYNYIFNKVPYPLENGYRFELVSLPPWMHIEIEKGADKRLVVFSRIHVRKEVRMNPSFPLDASDEDIIKYLSQKIRSMFLVTPTRG